MKLQLHPSWDFLQEELQKPYFQDIRKKLALDMRDGGEIFPPVDQIFSAFETVPFCNIRVVILGQDPYHGPGQAHGMSFSVAAGVKIPPSLSNIFQELFTDLGISPPLHGNLTHWANQGVFLLNAILSVQAGKPASHAKIGWEMFTDFVMSQISEQKDRVVFVLWGNFARQKKALIDTSKHFVIESAHPSPLSAHSGFFGSRPFSAVNSILTDWGEKPIDWNLE